MILADDDSVDSLRRCLFPEEGWDSDLPGNQMKPNHDADLADLRKDEHGSPTSIAGYPRQYPPNEELLIITMSENGAEVALDLSSPSRITPETKRDREEETTGGVRSNSLLDVDATPTPPRKKDISRNMGLCCASVAGQCYQEEEYEARFSKTSYEVEETIATFLEEDSDESRPYADCSDWQAWSFFTEGSTSESHSPSRENIRSNLRNRAFSLCARKSRIQQLRQVHSPFAVSPKRSPPPLMSKSRSFNIAEHGPGIVRVSRGRKQTNSSFKEAFQLCTMPENSPSHSPMTVRDDLLNFAGEDVCYDSDPEGFTRRRRVRKTPEQDKENGLDYDQYSYPQSISASPTGNIDDDLNENAFYTVVQELFNQSSTLICYPTTTSSSGEIQSSSPVAVQAWLERGQLLANATIQPKLMWKPKLQNGPNVHFFAVDEIELLDITRILKVQNLDRSLYPFAKSQHCFQIKTIDMGEYLFEAKSSTERNRLMYSLKMVIARFAAKIITQDQSIHDEFFSNMVGAPGRAPSLTICTEGRALL